MDFFAHQDAARAASRRLVVLLAIAVSVLVLMVNLLASGVMSWLEHFHNFGHPSHTHLIATAGTLAIVGLGMWWKHNELAGGGPALAAQLGGREVSPTTVHADERRLRNVVEEMAIAAGIPVPAVFVLDSLGINAFAAGRTLRDSAIAVTRGCLVELDRDELQAVVAHEISHLLNGDARLNLRLIAAVHGLLAISHAGSMLVDLRRDDGWGPDVRWSRTSRNDNEFAFVAVGLALMAIGGIGWLLGELVRAGVSRQREYLADAAAVQFTRNGTAVANALKKALRPGTGTLVSHRNTALASHLFFARATTGFTEWLATHPPLRERILRVDPAWDGSLLVLPSTRQVLSQAQAQAPSRLPALPGPGQVDFAANLLATLPAILTSAAGEAYSGRAAVLVTLLTANPHEQLARIQASDAALAALVTRLMPAWQAIDCVRARLPLLQLALPNLQRLTSAQRDQMLSLVDDIASMAGPTDRLAARLIRTFLIAERPHPDFHALKPLLPDITTALAVIAYASTEPSIAFNAGWSRLLVAGAVPAMPADPGSDALGKALDRLVRANGAIRRRIVDAVAHTVAADGQVSPFEAELLRLTCAALGTPLPLFRDFWAA